MGIINKLQTGGHHLVRGKSMEIDGNFIGMCGQFMGMCWNVSGHLGLKMLLNKGADCEPAKFCSVCIHVSTLLGGNP